MQHRSVLSQTSVSPPSPSSHSHQSESETRIQQPVSEDSFTQDLTGQKLSELTRVFNSVLLSSRTKRKKDFSAELYALVESPAFRAILTSIQQLAAVHHVSERQATEQVIQTFRKIDDLWDEYMFREGLDQYRNPRP